MKYVKPFFSFLFVFVFSFFLGGWFLMPYLPPTPDHLVSTLDAEYWETNWAGLILGVVLGGLSAWSVVRKQAKVKRKAAQGFPIEGSDVV